MHFYDCPQRTTMISCPDYRIAFQLNNLPTGMACMLTWALNRKGLLTGVVTQLEYSPNRNSLPTCFFCPGLPMSSNNSQSGLYITLITSWIISLIRSQEVIMIFHGTKKNPHPWPWSITLLYFMLTCLDLSLFIDLWGHSSSACPP